MIAPGSLVVLAGSLPPGAPVDAYARLVLQSTSAGARSVVDADGATLGEALAARPWMVKVNVHEATAVAGLSGTDEAVSVAAARAIGELTGGIVVVTRGLDGAIVRDESGAAWRIGGPPERGRYPVGSGDSLLAGLVVGLASGFSLPEAARRGCAVGAANALVPGQGELDPADADRMLPAIILARIG